MHLDINKTLCIDFNINFRHKCIGSYPHHTQQALGLVGMQGSWVGKT